MRICSVEGCGRKHAAMGFCRTHYYMNRYNTDEEYRKNTNMRISKRAHFRRLTDETFRNNEKQRKMKNELRHSLRRRIEKLEVRIKTLREKKFPIPIPLQSKYDCYCKLFESYFITKEEKLPNCPIPVIMVTKENYDYHTAHNVVRNRKSVWKITEE